MALLVSKNFSAMGGVDLTQLYVRFFIIWDFDGKKISVNTEKFVSKTAYKSGDSLPVNQVPEHLEFTYDSSTHGTDVLSFVHNQFKNWLITDQTEEHPILDPSTGELQFDPSTGELLTETVISVPKFAETGEISFVDLD